MSMIWQVDLNDIVNYANMPLYYVPRYASRNKITHSIRPIYDSVFVADLVILRTYVV